MVKSPQAFRTISEIATELDVPQHVLRFWEAKFTQIKPLRRGGGRRYYRPEDVDLIRGIRRLLYNEGYTIKGVQKVLREQGIRFVADSARADGAAADMAGELDVNQLELNGLEAAAQPASTGARKSGKSAQAGEIGPDLRAALEAMREELEAARASLDEALGE